MRSDAGSRGRPPGTCSYQCGLVYLALATGSGSYQAHSIETPSRRKMPYSSHENAGLGAFAVFASPSWPSPRGA